MEFHEATVKRGLNVPINGFCISSWIFVSNNLGFNNEDAFRRRVGAIALHGRRRGVVCSRFGSRLFAVFVRNSVQKRPVFYVLIRTNLGGPLQKR